MSRLRWPAAFALSAAGVGWGLWVWACREVTRGISRLHFDPPSTVDSLAAELAAEFYANERLMFPGAP